MREFLLNNVLPFWMEHSIDYECGGILNAVDREGRVYDTTKNVWFAGRTMYTYSKAYNEFDKNEKYLEVARVMYDFLPKCEFDSTGRLPFIVNREGRCIEKRRFYFSEPRSSPATHEMRYPRLFLSSETCLHEYAY